MNLDDLSLLKELDRGNMLAAIDALPDQLAQAWDLGQRLPLPDAAHVTRIVFCGMGTSALGAELLAAYGADSCPIPLLVWRDYGLPAFARGPETLVVVCSHSGESEEALDALGQALASGCSLLVVSGGGKLAQFAAENQVPLWRYEAPGAPNAALGFSFGLLLALFSRLGLIPDQAASLAGALAAMRDQQQNLLASVPAALNPAKRYAGQLVGRWVTFFGAGVMAPVARRWKEQVNLLAKAPANCESLPAADHNALAGLGNPSDLLMSRTLTLFIMAPSDHPRNRLRSEFTRQTFMLEGSNTDFYMAKGSTALAHLCTALHFGDYMTYYLAIAYQADPSAVEALQHLQEMLASL